MMRRLRIFLVVAAVGFLPVAVPQTIPFGFWKSSSAVDSDLAAFITASGATDTTGLATLIAYLKAESLWTHVRFFPFKSAQNKGSGTTVYGLGGWTSNNLTLDVGGTWAADGIDFDATDDRGSVTLTGLNALTELYTFDVQKPAAASSADANRLGFLSFGNTNGGGVSTNDTWIAHTSSGDLSGETIAVGINADDARRRKGTSGFTWSADEKIQIVIDSQSTVAMWKSKTSQTLSLSAGTNSYRPSDAGYSTDDILRVNCIRTGASTYSSFVAHTQVVLLLCKTSLTTTQRETITDYLDAL